MESSGIASKTREVRRSVRRELSQLLGLCEHVSGELQLLRREMDSRLAQDLVDCIEEHLEGPLPGEMRRTSSSIDQALSHLETAIEEIGAQMRVPQCELQPEGVPALPPRLARFLAERREIPGFQFEVRQDAVRGWVVLWKEYGDNGILRGAGQFYERPYAWMDD